MPQPRCPSQAMNTQPGTADHVKVVRATNYRRAEHLLVYLALCRAGCRDPSRWRVAAPSPTGRCDPRPDGQPGRRMSLGPAPPEDQSDRGTPPIGGSVRRAPPLAADLAGPRAAPCRGRPARGPGAMPKRARARASPEPPPPAAAGGSWLPKLRKLPQRRGGRRLNSDARLRVPNLDVNRLSSSKILHSTL